MLVALSSMLVIPTHTHTKKKWNIWKKGRKYRKRREGIEDKGKRGKEEGKETDRKGGRGRERKENQQQVYVFLNNTAHKQVTRIEPNCKRGLAAAFWK